MNILTIATPVQAEVCRTESKAMNVVTIATPVQAEICRTESKSDNVKVNVLTYVIEQRNKEIHSLQKQLLDKDVLTNNLNSQLQEKKVESMLLRNRIAQLQDYSRGLYTTLEGTREKLTTTYKKLNTLDKNFTEEKKKANQRLEDATRRLQRKRQRFERKESNEELQSIQRKT